MLAVNVVCTVWPTDTFSVLPLTAYSTPTESVALIPLASNPAVCASNVASVQGVVTAQGPLPST